MTSGGARRRYVYLGALGLGLLVAGAFFAVVGAGGPSRPSMAWSRSWRPGDSMKRKTGFVSTFDCTRTVCRPIC